MILCFFYNFFQQTLCFNYKYIIINPINGIFSNFVFLIQGKGSLLLKV